MRTAVEVGGTNSNSRESENGGGAWPSPRQGHTATAVGDRVFVYGGTRGAQFNNEVFSDLWVLNTTSMSWTSVPPTAQNPEHAPGLVGHTANSFTFVDSAKGNQTTTGIFFIGGRSGGARPTWQSDVWVLDTSTLRWRQAEISGGGGVHFAGREGHTAVVVGTNILVYGGYADEGSDVNTDSRVMVLDLSYWGAPEDSTLRWAALNTTGTVGPRRRTGNLGLFLNQKFFAVYNARGTTTSRVSGQVASIEYTSDTGSGAGATFPWHRQNESSVQWITTDGTAATLLNDSLVVAYGGCAKRHCRQDVQILRETTNTSSGFLGLFRESFWSWAKVNTTPAQSAVHGNLAEALLGDTAAPRGRGGHTVTLIPSRTSDRKFASAASRSENHVDFKLLMLGGCTSGRICAGGDAMYVLHVTNHPSDYVDPCSRSRGDRGGWATRRSEGI